MNKKLYVGNLLYEVSDEDLRDFFSQAGTVVSASVIRFQDSGRSKGFGFVEMEAEEDAQKAIDMFNGTDMKGRSVVVSEARPPQPRTNFGGGDRGDRPRRSFGGGGDRRGNGGYRGERDNRDNRNSGGYGGDRGSYGGDPNSSSYGDDRNDGSY